MDQEEIKKILPHREPFLLIDKITELKPGEYAAGLKLIRKDEFYIQCQGRDKCNFPFTLLIEAMAQLGAVAVLSLPECKGKISILAGVNNAVFYHQVQAGDEIFLEAKLIRFKGKIGKRKCRAMVKGKLVAEAEILYSLA